MIVTTPGPAVVKARATKAEPHLEYEPRLAPSFAHAIE